MRTEILSLSLFCSARVRVAVPAAAYRALKVRESRLWPLALRQIGALQQVLRRYRQGDYWEFLALAMGVVCVVTEWTGLDDKQDRFRLMWTQALHLVAVLVAMNIMLLSGVQQLLPAPATSLVLLLALGTFVAGLSLMSLQMAAVFLIGLGMTFWSRRGDVHPAKPEHQTSPYSGEPKGGDRNGTGAPREDGF